MRKLSALRLLSIGMLVAGALAFVYLVIIRPMLSGGPTGGGATSRIAFVSDRDGNQEIYTMNPDGSDVTRLTTNEVDDFAPLWSPDGARIGFISLEGGQTDLYVVNADGSGLNRLTNTEARESNIHWSPDGNQLLYEDSSGGLYIVGASGGNPVQAAPEGAANAGGPVQIAPMGIGFGVWSPDGTHIAAIRLGSNPGGPSEVVDITAATGEITSLSTLDGFAETPAWNPNGTPLVLPVSATTGNLVYVIHMDGSSPPTGFNSPGLNIHSLVWSPDGQALALTVWNTEGKGNVYLSDSQGHFPEAGPVFTSSEPWEASWSPNSAQLITQSQDEASGKFVLSVVNRDGTGSQPITDMSSSNLMPNWSGWINGPAPTETEASETEDVSDANLTLTPPSTPEPISTALVDQITPTLKPGLTDLNVLNTQFFPEETGPLDRNDPFQFGASVQFDSGQDTGARVLGFLLYADEAVPNPWACMSLQMPQQHPERPFWSKGEMEVLPPGAQAWEDGYLYNEPVAGTSHLVVWLQLTRGDKVVFCEQRVYALTPEDTSTPPLTPPPSPTGGAFTCGVCGDGVCQVAPGTICNEDGLSCPADCANAAPQTDWQTYTSQPWGFSLAHPPDWEASETNKSVLFSIPKTQGPAFPQLWVSVIEHNPSVTSDSSVYNFISSAVLKSLLGLPVGDTIQLGQNSLDKYDTFMRLPDQTVAGRSAVVIENSSVWEGGKDLKDRRVIMLTDNGLWYVIGCYWQTPEELATFEAVVQTFALGPVISIAP